MNRKVSEIKVKRIMLKKKILQCELNKDFYFDILLKDVVDNNYKVRCMTSCT